MDGHGTGQLIREFANPPLDGQQPDARNRRIRHVREPGQIAVCFATARFGHMSILLGRVLPGHARLSQPFLPARFCLAGLI
jgi:hypothetical protein